MTSKKPKHNISKITIITVLTSISLTACMTTKLRDERLTQNLEKQNAVIDATEVDRNSETVKAEIEKSDELKEAEARLQKALEAIKASNEAVISKIKPTTKKECDDEQDEGSSNE